MTLLKAVNTGATLNEDQISCLLDVIAGKCSLVTQVKLANRLRDLSQITPHPMFTQVEIDEQSAEFTRVNDYRTELLTIRKALLRGKVPDEINLTKAKQAIAKFAGLKSLPSAALVHNTISYLRSAKLTEAEQQLFEELKL